MPGPRRAIARHDKDRIIIEERLRPRTLPTMRHRPLQRVCVLNLAIGSIDSIDSIKICLKIWCYPLEFIVREALDTLNDSSSGHQAELTPARHAVQELHSFAEEAIRSGSRLWSPSPQSSIPVISESTTTSTVQRQSVVIGTFRPVNTLGAPTTGGSM